MKKLVTRFKACWGASTASSGLSVTPPPPGVDDMTSTEIDRVIDGVVAKAKAVELAVDASRVESWGSSAVDHDRNCPRLIPMTGQPDCYRLAVMPSLRVWKSRAEVWHVGMCCGSMSASGKMQYKLAMIGSYHPTMEHAAMYAAMHMLYCIVQHACGGELEPFRKWTAEDARDEFLDLVLGLDHLAAEHLDHFNQNPIDDTPFQTGWRAFVPGDEKPTRKDGTSEGSGGGGDA